MELDESTYDQVKELSEQGNICCDDGRYTEAMTVWNRALALLPEPRSQWEAALWLNASLADASFLDGNYADARAFAFDALNCPDGTHNPLVLLRLGQASLELGLIDDALEYLTRAYAMEGEELFDAEQPKYLQLLRDRGLT